MRRISIKNVLVPLSFLLLMMLASCQEDYAGLADTHTDPVEVGFHAGGARTRTEMLEDGLSATWVTDDKIALWAKNSSGAYILSNQTFKTYGYDDAKGYFTSTLSSAMPEDTYTYYCTYPVPSSVTGTIAEFYVPSTQDGKASGGADVMVSTPVTYGPLSTIPDPEDHSGMSMEMNRVMHQFRFLIPSEDTPLARESIVTMRLTFPADVVGNIMVNFANPTGWPTLMQGSGEITLNLADPISYEKGNYACVAFVPTVFNEGQELQLKAYTSDKIVQFDPINLKAKTCLPGHSTPVILIPTAVVEYPYQISFKVVGNNLGENVNEVRLEAPSGCRWPMQESNVYTYSRTDGGKITVGEEIIFRFEDEAQYEAFSNAAINVTYDSDNAITRQSVTLADLTSQDKVSVNLTIPFLFYEDFSSVPSFSDGYDNETVGLASDLYKGIKELSEYTSTMAGWFATRIGVQGGTAARICCRYEDVLGASAYYKGRLYTPFLSNIKEDSNVKISVSFKYGGDRKEMRGWGLKYPQKSPMLYFGINTQENVINPDQNEGDLIDQITGMIGGSGFSSMAPTSLSPMAIKGEAIPMGGSYTSFAGTRTVTIDNVDCGMRLGWILSTDCEAGSINANYWFYIDDIKVQIVNE